MFPIPSKRKLSIVEIADYWSGEITPPRSAQDLRDEISKAWWRGELTAANGLSRLSVLRAYYLKSAKSIAFAIPNAEEPPQWVADDDGVVEFVIEVPLPNANPDTWTEANCGPAFNALAQWWKEAIICSPSAPILLDIVLTSSEFFQWVAACGYKRPTFWSDALQKSDQPTDRTIPVWPSSEASGTRPAPDKVSSEKLAKKFATKKMIKEAIDTIYSAAEKSGAKPPNIKELPPQVRNFLESSGYTASARQIQELGSHQDFKNRRRPVGRTLKSERRGG